MSDLRIEKGREIAATGLVVRAGNAWLVPSLSSDAIYKVMLDERGELRCNCPDFARRREPCKHIVGASIVAAATQ